MVNFQFKNTFFLYYVLEHSKIVHLVRKPLFYTIYILLPTIAVTSKLFQALDGALDGHWMAPPLKLGHVSPANERLRQLIF